VDKNKYASYFVNVSAQNKFWLLMSLGLLASNLLLSATLLFMDKTQKVVVTPPDFDRPFWVKGKEASAEYIESMARYFSQLMLSYNKESAKSQFEIFLKFANPEVYGLLKNKLYDDVDRIRLKEISSAFYLMSIHVKKQTAVVGGEQVTMMGSQIVARSQKYYEFRMRYTSAGISVLGFSEVKPTSDKFDDYQSVDYKSEMLLETQQTAKNAESEGIHSESSESSAQNE